MDEDFVLKRVEQSIRKAQRLGAKIVTLAGFTSIVGNEGEVIAKRVDIAVTNGNTYTASLAIDGVIEAAHVMDLDLSGATLAVIGATGDIGSICTKILSKKVKRVNIAARNEKRLLEFSEALKRICNAEITVYKSTKEAVREADIILTVTSAISAIIGPEDIKSGAIVCDVAIPANVATGIINGRNDVFVFEGGLAKLPYSGGVKDRILANLMPPRSIYGCLAEGVVLAFEGKLENYSIGRDNITEEKVNEISAIAKKHGVQLADFFCGYRVYSEEDIETIKRNAKRKEAYGGR
jgi:predicted amino acid dehydrogenase